MHLKVLILLIWLPITSPWSISDTFQFVKCKLQECCGKPYLVGNFSGLNAALRDQLYGQHLVKQIIKPLKEHYEDHSPKKALVLSFHGWTGSGKNYVASMIAEHLFAKGMKSSYVHLFVASLHFAHSGEVASYKQQLLSRIKKSVSKCERSLFIFDELDKMAIGVLDAIKPFIDYHRHLDGVDYRKSTFIFLSNTGGNDITQKTLQQHEDGKLREKISLQEMQDTVKLAAFNEESGLRHSRLIDSHLIDHFVPFLPLEREHVKLCIRNYLKLKGYPLKEDLIKAIADQLSYRPKSKPIYAAAGCKQIAHKAELYQTETEDDFFRDEF